MGIKQSFMGLGLIAIVFFFISYRNLKSFKRRVEIAPLPHQESWPDTNEENSVLVVLSSNREEGIIPSIASILNATSSRPVDVVLIGDPPINEQVRRHFGTRIHNFVSLTVADIEKDLVDQGRRPIWTWSEWHSSFAENWSNENTVRTASWDHRGAHAHELNHVRFYLPQVSMFRNRDYLYFVDDDILVQEDLGTIAQYTMASLSDTRGLVTPCNIWKWNDSCQHFGFTSQQDKWNETSPLYGDSSVCKSEADTNCVPDNFRGFLQQHTPVGGEDQLAWNFGFSLFALKHWRDLRLTERYETIMKENYRLHVFPETSLSFGLGVPFLAFAGAVECWNENKVAVRDGFGFIDYESFQTEFGEDFISKVSVLHYTGAAKPWQANVTIPVQNLQPWLDVMLRENMPLPPQLPARPSEQQLFTMVASDNADSEMLMTVLDHHPSICAPGQTNNPAKGFPAGLMNPEGLSWYNDCSYKKGCTYSFVYDNVMKLTNDTVKGELLPKRCAESYDTAMDPIAIHLPQLCNFVKKLAENFTQSAIARTWMDAFYNEDKSLLHCSCKRGATVKGLKVKPQWLAYEFYPGNHTNPAKLDLNHTRLVGQKMIRLRRKNLWARYKFFAMQKETGIWNPKTGAQEAELRGKLSDFNVDLDELRWELQQYKEIDFAGDQWVQDHASDVLWLNYEDCKDNRAACLTRICKFLGVDESEILNDEESKLLEKAFRQVSIDNTLDYVINQDEVRQVLEEFGWGDRLALS